MSRVSASTLLSLTRADVFDAQLTGTDKAGTATTMNDSLLTRLVAEAAGTMFLLAAVVGSGIMADDLAADNSAVALLANAVVTGAMLTVLITVLAPLSGAHFNPAVTLGFALRKQISIQHSTGYVLAQAAGAVAGVVAAHAMFGMDLVQTATQPRSGMGQWLAEVVATFGLVSTILGTLRVRPNAVSAMVGLYITAACWFTSSTSFANPAVTLGRVLTDTFTGIAPVDAGPFIACQAVGAVLAVSAFSFLPQSGQSSEHRVCPPPNGRTGK